MTRSFQCDTLRAITAQMENRQGFNSEMTEWRSKLILQEGEKLKHTGTRTSGFMAETDVDTYDIVNAEGFVTGSVIVEDHTAVKGLKRTISVTQRSSTGQEIVRESWTDRS